MNKFLLPLASIAVLAAPMVANAAACRDAHGRFAICAHAAAAKPLAQPPRMAAAKAQPKHCKINGRFASCSAPGAKPA